ncbi:hypothetical protein [Parafrankia sp. CH37]|uniref:hypothetical protein n=1 Tax=Parafrankia sp. CH37 TaxID=683308 RepID=UPI001865AC6A|nr:hypothetical protein [Parafrankia sp. CH37]MBE3206782.1 hypothetical protein [Parafrankia sp. CH37]
MTRLGELQAAAAPWTRRPAPLVHTDDQADLAVWEQIADECTALGDVDTALTARFGIPGVARDLWLAAYARSPQLLDAGEVEDARRPARAILAAQLGSPEHRDLRRLSTGDPYLAAMAVLAQAAVVRAMIEKLDKAPQGTAGQRARAKLRQARREETATAAALRRALDAAADSVDGDPDGEVDQPQVVDVQRAIADADGAAADAAAAAQAAQEADAGEDSDGLDGARVRAAARAAAAQAETELVAQAAAATRWGWNPASSNDWTPMSGCAWRGSCAAGNSPSSRSSSAGSGRWPPRSDPAGSNTPKASTSA